MEERNMKKIYAILAAAALLAAASCTKENITAVNDGPVCDEAVATRTFTADYSSDTKLAFDGATKVAWEAGDVITIADAAGNSAVHTVAASEIDAANASKVTFSAELGAAPYYAVVGKGSVDAIEGAFNIKPALDGTFSSADLLVAGSTSTSLAFKHAMGIVAVSASTPNVTAVHFAARSTTARTYVDSLKVDFASTPTTAAFTTKDNTTVLDIMSSNIVVPCSGASTVYFPLAAGNYAGFDLTFTTSDGKAYTVGSDNPLDITAGEVIKLGDVTSKLQSLVFYESFDGCKGNGGNDNLWAPSVNGKLVMDNEGWTMTSGFGMRASSRFGTSSKLGSAVTPALGLESGKDYVLRFKAAAYKNNKDLANPLLLSVEGAGSLAKTSITLTTDAWKVYEVAITGADASTKVKFSGAAASNGRFLLDEVMVIGDGNSSGEQPAEPEVLAKWKLDYDTMHETGGDLTWAGSNITGASGGDAVCYDNKAGDGGRYLAAYEGSAVARMSFVQGDKTALDPEGTIASRKMFYTGHPGAGGFIPDDYFLFTVEKAIPAGTKIRFTFTLRLNNTGSPKYWAVEILDGSNWVMMADQDGKTSYTADDVTYNLVKTSTANVITPYTHTLASSAATLQMRIRTTGYFTAAGTYTGICNKDLRFRPDGNGTAAPIIEIIQ